VKHPVFGCMQALLKAQRPPSKGGPDIPVPDAAGGLPSQGAAGPFQQSFQQQPQQPAAVYGQQHPASSFGQVQQSAAPAAAFGQSAAAPKIVFGQAAPPPAAFSSSAARTPGFGSSPAGSPFGLMPSTAGATAPGASASPSMVASPFGSTAAAAAPASFGMAATRQSNAFGFGGSAAAPQLTQQQQGGFVSAAMHAAPGAGQTSMQPGSLGQGPGFGQSMVAAAMPSQPQPNGQHPPEGLAHHICCKRLSVHVIMYMWWSGNAAVDLPDLTLVWLRC
jgi:hypothetical protein